MAASLKAFLIVSLLILAVLLSKSCYALYADQVGKFDWAQRYLGKVKYAYFDHSTHKAPRIIVSTENNVVASLNSRSGDIHWRQILENGPTGRIDSLIIYNNDVLTVSGGGLVRCWQASTGILNWETSTSDVSQSESLHSIVTYDKKGLLVLNAHDVHLLSLPSGKIKWTISLPDSETVVYQYMVSTIDKVHVVGIVPESHVSVVSILLDNGEVALQSSIPASWAVRSTPCLLSDTAKLVCYDSRMKHLYGVDVPYGKTFRPTALSDFVEQTTNVKEVTFVKLFGNYFSIRLLQEDKYMHSIVYVDQSGALSLLETWPRVSVLAPYTNADTKSIVIFSRQSSRGGSLAVFSLGERLSLESEIEINLPVHQGNPEYLFPFIFSKKESSIGFRALLVSEDHSASFYVQAGEAMWSREEALASIASVEMADLPVSEIQAKFEEEFGSSKVDIVSMFLRRVSTQLSELQLYIAELLQRLYGSDKLTASEKRKRALVRDEFNIHKVIVVSTTSGKLYGIDNLSGDIIWRYLIPNVVPFKQQDKNILPLFVMRTTAHFPHLPEFALLGKNKLTGKGILYVFNPITGRQLNGEQALIDFDYQVKQAYLLNQHDDNFLRPIVLIDEERKVHLFPKSAEKVMLQNVGQQYVYNVDPDTGILTGYSVHHDRISGFLTREVWRAALPQENQDITHVVPKRQNEHVHSQGRVLGDRSVLYKYLNPNLAVVVTEGMDQQERAFASLYLIDVVTGEIVFSTQHQKAKGPMHIVHAENWVVYNYWNQKLRRNEIAALEMYEGKTQSNTTAFSSLNPPPPPIVERQSYIFPFSITAMTSTITERGITSKHLIVALADGGILDLPKAFLDPRRPNHPTVEHREEGLIPYIPELQLPKEAIINYNRSVFNIHGIHTAPAGLESTCLVFAYGLDLFSTRVWPSKMFDVLKDDFDHWLISVVLGALILSSLILQKLAARKQLKTAWK